ncbi:MAG: hypothetical protein K0V04_17605 [Deltaproteobacteria bacterium]|nr:hypothetical protein [Deltaproteobacteria bacterium]
MPILTIVVVTTLLATVALVVGGLRSPLGADAAGNPTWPAHARFHATTLGLTHVGAGVLVAGMCVAQLPTPERATLLFALAVLAVVDLVELGADVVPRIRDLRGPDPVRGPMLAHLGIVLVAISLTLTLEP